MATPHIAAGPGDFAPTVLMSDDPKRAQRIAEFPMDDARLIIDMHGMLGFTETTNGRPLSIMGSGMGQSFFTIYTTELFSQFGVERIIRVDTVGALSLKVKVGDVIAAIGAHTDSSTNRLRIPGVNSSAVAGFQLASAAYQALQLEGVQVGGVVHLGTVMPRDHFYFILRGQTEALASYGAPGVEMEAAALYEVAAGYDKQVLMVLTVSDCSLDHSSGMSTTERETRFADPLCLAVVAAHS